MDQALSSFFDGLSLLIVKQIFFSFFFTLCIEFVPPQGPVYHQSLSSMGSESRMHFWRCHYCSIPVFCHVGFIQFSLTNPWSQSEGFLCDAPTVRSPVAPSGGNVLLGNTWSSVNNPICFLMSHVTHPTLNELLARSLGVLSQTGIYGSEERLSGFSFQKALRFFFSFQ